HQIDPGWLRGTGAVSRAGLGRAAVGLHHIIGAGRAEPGRRSHLTPADGEPLHHPRTGGDGRLLADRHWVAAARYSESATGELPTRAGCHTHHRRADRDTGPGHHPMTPTYRPSRLI